MCQSECHLPVEWQNDLNQPEPVFENGVNLPSIQLDKVLHDHEVRLYDVCSTQVGVLLVKRSSIKRHRGLQICLEWRILCQIGRTVGLEDGRRVLRHHILVFLVSHTGRVFLKDVSSRKFLLDLNYDLSLLL